MSTAPAEPPRPSRLVARRLAELMTRLTEREQLVEHLRDQIDPLRSAKLFAVTGEHTLLATITKQVDEARESVRAAASGPAGAQIDRLVSLLEGPRWRCAEEILPILTEQGREQRELLAGVQADVHSWTTRVGDLTAALASASAEGASVIDDRSQVVMLESLLMQVKRAYAAQRCHQVFVKLDELNTRFEQIDQEYRRQHGAPLLEVLQRKLEEATLLKRRTEIVVLRRDKRKSRVVEYTVLLRIYGESAPTTLLPGESRMTERDRDSAVRLIEQVTTTLNTRLHRQARDVATRPAPPGPPPRDMVEQLRNVGDMLYSLILPEAIQRHLAGDSSGSLTITTNDVEIPWELMHDGENFLCQGRPFSRMPVSPGFPQRVRHRPRTTDGQLKFLLVYADPDSNLPKAEEEINAIETYLEENWNSPGRKLIQITTLKGDEATGHALNDALLSGGYHVIHYAGHAKFSADKPEQSCLMLAGDEPFMAHKIQRITRGSPFVFLNACDSSKVGHGDDPSTTYLGQEHKGLASAFVYGGASACVGALWPVYDDLAAEFARNFYENLLGGAVVGEAIRDTREKARARDAAHITWAAYALYGNPTTRLPALPVSLRASRRHLRETT
ncbi:CHAT domain-containing protein [Kibdelosporangium aridum]|uniref:CHAT domain-containing protein n=1 Tax=Kibdelosporangium aridum TaxID=2030 RepID=A0A428ZKR8_KIBAR|nr:CHAT domain-containing protein [Kibdelosporangium aridum]RSM88692.1 CHAT domain-containing protein [Kibdelosporangium aridum]